jgi:hypothetical protein
MRTGVRAFLTLAALALVPVAAESQWRPSVLSPEYAASIQTFRGEPSFGAAVKTFTARVNIRPHEQVSPWVAAGFVVRGPSCRGDHCEQDGWLLVPGLRIDAVGGPHDRGIRPYMVAGAGLFVDSGDSPYLLPSVGAGVRWSERNAIAPRIELRWERFGGNGYAMLGVGLGFVLGSSVTAIER